MRKTNKGLQKMCESIVQKLDEELHSEIEVSISDNQTFDTFMLHIVPADTVLKFVLYIDKDESIVLEEQYYNIRETFKPYGIEPEKYFADKLSNLVKALIEQTEDAYFLSTLADKVVTALRNRLSSLGELPILDVCTSQIYLPLDTYFIAFTLKNTDAFFRLGFELKFSLSVCGLALICHCYPVNSRLKVPSELTTEKCFVLSMSDLVDSMVDGIIHCFGREVHHSSELLSHTTAWG